MTAAPNPPLKHPPSAGERPTVPAESPPPAVSLPLYGTTLILGAGVVNRGGSWLDHQKGGGWRWTLAGLVLGLVYIAYETWKLVRLLRDESRQPTDRDRNDEPQRPEP